MFYTEGLKEDVQLVGGTVGDEHLDVFRWQLNSAFPLLGELCEQLELLQHVALRHFTIFYSKDYFLKLVASQENSGFPDDLPLGGLSCGVQPLHRRAALQLIPGASVHQVGVLLALLKQHVSEGNRSSHAAALPPIDGTMQEQSD